MAKPRAFRRPDHLRIYVSTSYGDGSGRKPSAPPETLFAAGMSDTRSTQKLEQMSAQATNDTARRRLIRKRIKNANRLQENEPEKDENLYVTWKFSIYLMKGEIIQAEYATRCPLHEFSLS